MSGESMKQSWGQHRAVWDLSKEQVLLDVFDKTRQNPALRTDRGLKARGWDHESGFPHVDVCRRIASGKDELTDKTGSPHARLSAIASRT
ncbi:Hypothetical protein PHPALM_2066 [Phytophthora palmivora]|uniref:Uncharacterized protein n=1 Tax=Phytophthora palmivora TaxID=4796 RepID=A0A2P4YQS4_9STRA|nr:Hypothetical protein PHPALM_2066 [Phytophthora palmivora]